MKRFLVLLTISAGIIWFPASGFAKGARISDFETYKKSDETVTLTKYKYLMHRLIGAYEAIGWVNVWYEEKKKPLFFCPPDDFRITPKYLRKMLDDEIRDHNFSSKPYPADMPMDAIVMFSALKHFPCK